MVQKMFSMKWNATNRSIVVFALTAALITFLMDEAHSAPKHLRKTVGQFQDMFSSSKDCVVYIKPSGKEEIGFMIYGDCDDSKFKVSSLNPAPHIGRMVEVISYKNRLRAELEIIKSIRFVK